MTIENSGALTTIVRRVDDAGFGRDNCWRYQNSQTYIFRSRIARQIEKDTALVADGRTDLQGVVWHFVASNRSSSVGADPRVLDDAGIPYVIHLP